MPGMWVAGGDDVCLGTPQRVANALIIGVSEQGGPLPLNPEA